MDPLHPERPGRVAARPANEPSAGPGLPGSAGNPSRGVLNELARGFLLGLQSQDPEVATRFASQFLRDQTAGSGEHPPIRPRTVRGPLPRAGPDGRSIEPPPR